MTSVLLYAKMCIAKWLFLCMYVCVRKSVLYLSQGLIESQDWIKSIFMSTKNIPISCKQLRLANIVICIQTYQKVGYCFLSRDVASSNGHLYIRYRSSSQCSHLLLVCRAETNWTVTILCIDRKPYSQYCRQGWNSLSCKCNLRAKEGMTESQSWREGERMKEPRESVLNWTYECFKKGKCENCCTETPHTSNSLHGHQVWRSMHPQS